MRIFLLKRLFTFCSAWMFMGCMMGVQAQGLKIEYKDPWGIYKISYNNHVLMDVETHIGRPLTLEAYKMTKNRKDIIEWSHPTSQRWYAATNECKKSVSSRFNLDPYA